MTKREIKKKIKWELRNKALYVVAKSVFKTRSAAEFYQKLLKANNKNCKLKVII